MKEDLEWRFIVVGALVGARMVPAGPIMDTGPVPARMAAGIVVSLPPVVCGLVVGGTDQ